MQPKLKQYENIYRGPANSSEYNKLRETLYSDITTLYNITTNHDVNIQKNMDTMMKTNFFIQNQLLKLEAQLEDIENTVLSGSNSKYLTKVYTDLDNTSYELENVLSIDESLGKLSVDNLNRTLNLTPMSKQSRLYMTDETMTNYVPSNLYAEVFEGTTMENVAATIDSEVYNAFDGNRFTFWTKTVKHPNTVDNVYAHIHVSVPAAHNSSIKANELLLHSCPEYSQSIIKVQYKTLNTDWIDLPTFPVDNLGVQQEIEYSGKTKFIFPTLDITDLSIWIKQPTWIADGESRSFTYGFQAIELSYNEYSSTPGRIFSVFDLTEAGKTFKKVKTVTSKFADGSILDAGDSIGYKLYYEYNNGSSIGLGEFNVQFPVLDCKKVYLLTEINKKNNITPLIKSTTIEYETN